MRPDIYIGIHKGLRKSMFELALLAGNTNYLSDESLQKLRTATSTMIQFLQVHGHHEDNFMLSILEEKKPGAAKDDSEDHVRIDAELEEISASLDKIINMPVAERNAAGYQFYHQLNHFISDYLNHMHREEMVTNALLQELCTDEEIHGILANILKSNTPEYSMIALSNMLPSMNRYERAGLLLGARKTMPAPVFEKATNLAQALISEEDYAHLQEQLAVNV